MLTIAKGVENSSRITGLQSTLEVQRGWILISAKDSQRARLPALDLTSKQCPVASLLADSRFSQADTALCAQDICYLVLPVVSTAASPDYSGNEGLQR